MSPRPSSARGLVTRGVPTLPKGFNYLIVLIILLSIIILGLAAHAEALSGSYYYESSVPGFLIFVVCTRHLQTKVRHGWI